ncbi:hypothetical protein EXS74_04060 [Candidatus Woesearchaeota archaeon]|nr:hypothetical protein [Candidatus Woesearchaeota archaeon]
MTRQLLETYTLVSDGITGVVSIYQDSEENVGLYDLVNRGYELEEKSLIHEFAFLQQLQKKYPSLSYPKLFAKYYSLHIWYLEDYSSDNLF